VSQGPFIKTSIRFAVAAAVIYSLFAFFFIEKADYTASWILYVGNFLFMTVIAIFLFYIGSLKNNDPTTLSLIVTGEKTVFMGIAISLILCFILLLIFIPGILGRGVPGRVMIDKPANTIHDRTGGLDFDVMVNAVIGNFVTGSFVSVIFSPSLKRNHKEEEATAINN
jgi:hypothetical protein